MTDEKDKPDTESPEAEAEGPVGGERLAEARRAKQISVLEIAKELHVEEAKIRALENNEFEVLGAPVFAKGHLKKYSQLVGVNGDDVMADYYRLTRSQEMPPLVIKHKKPKREPSPGPWIGAFLLVVLLALAYWMLVERPLATQPAPAVSAPATSGVTRPPASARADDAEDAPAAGTPMEENADAPPLERDTDAPPQEEIADAADPAEQPLPDTPTSQPPAEDVARTVTGVQQPLPAAAQETAAPAAGGDNVRLSVTFLGDCWTEITDASGRRLFFQLGRSGRTVNLSGAAPLNVLFGDADNVDIRVNGEDFTIPAANRRGRTARLTISAQ
jgi:cytoskeleton protein RodZ